MGEHSDLPPRLRNWTEGTPQVGVFIRTRKGSVISLVNDLASEDQEAIVLALIMGTDNIPKAVLQGLREYVSSQVGRMLSGGADG